MSASATETGRGLGEDRRLVPHLRRQLRARNLTLNLLAGLVVGIVVVIVALSFAALIFSGDLAVFVPNGIGLALYTSVVVGVVVALSSSFPGMVATPQDSPAAITALLAAATAAAMPAVAGSAELFATVVAAIGLTTALTGLFFLLLGYFKLGGLVRFLPYPVIGGFLAGTGWLLLRGSIGVMAGVSPRLGDLGALFADEVLLRWLPGAIFGTALFLVFRRYGRYLILPGMLLGSIALFYLALALTDVSIAEAETRGLLLGPLPSGELWRPLGWGELGQIHWGVLWSQLGNMAVLLLVSVVALLLNASGLELVVQRDIDLDRELRGAGVANVVAGLGGGFVGFQTLSLSLLGHRMASSSRLVGLLTAAVCALTLFLGSSVLSLFPKASLGGLLFFLGLAFLGEWVYDAWFKLPRLDYFVVLVILVVIGTVGFLESVGMGIVIAVVLFAVNYSRIDVVKHSLSGADHTSNVVRPRRQRRLLQEKGDRHFILRLQGFLFFGTANNLLERLRARLDDPDSEPVRYVVLDFRLVSGLDSSAVLSFVKMRQFAEARGFELIFTHLAPEIVQQLERGGFAIAEDDLVRTFPELDRGVEWCEDRLLEGEGIVLEEHPPPLAEQLTVTFPELPEVERLMGYLERLEADTGYYLMRQGEAAEDLFFIESGAVTVQLELADGETLRLMTIGAGTVIGEMELYMDQPRSASVVAERPCVIYRLSSQDLTRMGREASDLAAAFHKLIARLLAERLARSNRTMEALLS
ncbi:MAG: SulP family inorganic anion transporter [Thermoanaerobaculia bacterium]